MEQDPHVVPLLESNFHGTEVGSRDITVIKLTENAAKAILAEKRPLTLGDFESNAPVGKGPFITMGYPQEWFQIGESGFEFKPLPFLGLAYNGEIDQIDEMKYDRAIHGAFSYNANNSIRTRDGLQVPLPNFKGMQGISGCGIWQVSSTTPKNSAPCQAESCRLVAIQHRYDQSKSYVLGTWIRFALERLLVEYPELKPSFSILRPRN